LLEAVNIGAKIEFARQNAVAASMPRQKRNFAAFQRRTASSGELL